MASFDRVNFERSPGFQGAHFAEPDGFQGTSLGAWRDLLPKHNPNDRRPYTQLETVLRACGNDRDAEDVYLTYRSRDRARFWQEKLLYALEDSPYWPLAHFGVRPYPLLANALLLLFLGVVVFSRPHAVTLT